MAAGARPAGGQRLLRRRAGRPLALSGGRRAGTPGCGARAVRPRARLSHAGRGARAGPSNNDINNQRTNSTTNTTNTPNATNNNNALSCHYYLILTLLGARQGGAAAGARRAALRPGRGAGSGAFARVLFVLSDFPVCISRFLFFFIIYMCFVL